MKSVFISYADSDKNKVNHISIKLKKTNFFNPVVIADDRKSLKSLSEKVKEGIDCCDIFIPILTRNSINTQWINQEIGYAISKYQ